MRLSTSPPSCAECYENLGALISWNPLGHIGPVTGLLYLFYTISLVAQRVKILPQNSPLRDTAGRITDIEPHIKTFRRTDLRLIIPKLNEHVLLLFGDSKIANSKTHARVHCSISPGLASTHTIVQASLNLICT